MSSICFKFIGLALINLHIMNSDHQPAIRCLSYISPMSSYHITFIVDAFNDFNLMISLDYNHFSEPSFDYNHFSELSFDDFV